MERRTHHSVYELLQQERYTPEEVAELLGIGVHIIQHAASSMLPSRVSCKPRSSAMTSSASAGTTSWPGWSCAKDWIGEARPLCATS